jgi:hypothetical protein
MILVPAGPSGAGKPTAVTVPEIQAVRDRGVRSSLRRNHNEAGSPATDRGSEAKTIVIDPPERIPDLPQDEGETWGRSNQR